MNTIENSNWFYLHSFLYDPLYNNLKVEEQPKLENVQSRGTTVQNFTLIDKNTRAIRIDILNLTAQL